MAQQINFTQHSPFRRPDWRFERVLQMVDRPGDNPGRSTRRDDDYIRGFRNFILRYRSGDSEARNKLGFENAGLYFAYQIHERANEEPNLPTLLEARILADQTDEQIAKEICCPPEAVHWYEALFFNVRDRLAAHDWMMTHVLMPAYVKSGQDWEEASQQTPMPGPMPIARPFFDATLKFMAYFGKTFVLDYVISGFTRGLSPTTREGVGEWFDNHYMTRAKHRASMAMSVFEVNRYNVMQLFEINNQIINIQKSADDAGDKETATTKAIHGMMREMKFAVGREGLEMVVGTVIEQIDKGASEVRDDELLILSAGQKIGTMDMLPSLPLPRRKPGQEDQVHANSQQGS